MKLLSHKAEQALLEKARSLNASHNSWRCIYINFSDHKEHYNEGIRTHIVTSILKDLLEMDDGYIYLCADGDIFILFKGMASTILECFGEQFKLLGNENGVVGGAREFYTIFDLEKHWAVFMDLCEAKVSHDLQAKSVLPPAVKNSGDIYKPDPDVFKHMALARNTRQRPLILVVEDDPFTRKLIKVTLKELFDVVEATDGNSAMQIYETSAPDVVFLDIDLPDINGHVVLSRLLALDPVAFIAMLSAHSIKENILAALEKGAQGFITKPFTREKLLHYICLSKAGRPYCGKIKGRL